jgi:hypothetical protein
MSRVTSFSYGPVWRHSRFRQPETVKIGLATLKSLDRRRKESATISTPVPTAAKLNFHNLGIGVQPVPAAFCAAVFSSQ